MRPRRLTFDEHLADYVALVSGGDVEADSYFAHRAQEMHSLEVCDALRDLGTESILFGWKLKQPDARSFAIYGAGRRLGMTWTAYRELIHTIPPDRTEPLSIEETSSVGRDLNAIYLNIIGVLDNYAWLLLHELGEPATKALHPTKVGLFNKEFRKDTSIRKLESTLAAHETWLSQLKAKRDPAAHRIPLAVPPSLLNEAEASQYQHLEKQIGDAFSKQDWARVDALREEQGQLGTFSAFFLHDPADQKTPLYPTVPSDLGATITIVSAIHREFSP